MEPLAWYRIVGPIAAAVGLVVFVTLRPMQRFQCGLMGMLVLVGYGMLQDQVSARLCPEYFTVFHPPIPGLTDPTLLGIAWGFLGSWWGGFLMGYVAGVAATYGSYPTFGPRELLRPMLVLVLVVGIATALTGVSVWRHAEMMGVRLGPYASSVVPPERRIGLLVVACSHFVTYAVAVLGSIVLCLWVAWQRRARLPCDRMQTPPELTATPEPSGPGR